MVVVGIDAKCCPAARSDGWLRCDDSVVKEIYPEEVAGSRAAVPGKAHAAEA